MTLSQWSYSLSLGLPVCTMKLPPPSVLSGDQERLVPVHPVNGLISVTASDMTWQMLGGLLWRVEQHSVLKLGEREVLARCPLTGTLGSGAFIATEHSPPVPTWPKAAASFPLCVVCCFSSCGLRGITCMVLELLGLQHHVLRQGVFMAQVILCLSLPSAGNIGEYHQVRFLTSTFFGINAQENLFYR